MTIQIPPNVEPESVKRVVNGMLHFLRLGYPARGKKPSNPDDLIVCASIEKSLTPLLKQRRARRPYRRQEKIIA